MARSARNAPTDDGQTLDALLRDAGLRRTEARVAVLRYLRSHPGPQSHSDVQAGLAARGHERFDRVTVYRVLNDLATAAVLTRTDLGDHVWRFALASAAPHREAHPHFLCTQCGAIACLPGLALRVDPASGAPRAVREQKVEVQLRGRCDACAR